MNAEQSVSTPTFLARGGELGSMIAALNWAATPLGALDEWPAYLRHTVALMLRAKVPMVIFWGRAGHMIYNDAYRDIAGARHPEVLGVSVLEAWPELASFNARVIDEVLAGGTLAYRDEHLVILRSDKPEDIWLHIDYSPIVDDDGTPVAVMTLVKDTTKRVQVEQRLRIAQQAGGVGTFEWFPEDGRLEVSDEYRRIWGLEGDVAVTESLLVGLVHPDDRHAAGTNRLDRPNPLDYAEYRRLDPVTGSIRWIARRGEVIAGPEHARSRYLGIAMDITDRKLAEQAVRESESRWRNLFEQMQEGFFIGEAVRDERGQMIDFVFVELNPAFEQQTGVEISLAMGRPLSEVLPGTPVELMQRYAKVLATGVPDEFELQVAALEDRWFEARVRPAGGDRFAVLFVDISLRKASERVIAESAERFRSMAQSMPNHVWTSRPDGLLDWFNERVYTYAGVPHGTLDGEAWATLVHPEEREEAARAWVDAIARGQNYETEFRIRRHDGEWRWHIVRAVPQRDSDGRIDRWIGTNTDIEDQKAAEAALSNLAATLEDRVAQRTGELLRTQDALRQSQKMESLGNLTGGVAHDFNNLLQVISGNLQLLSADIAGNERAERRVANAMSGVARGSKLATQLLAFGRRQPLAPKVVNIGRFIRDMDDLLRRALGEAIEVETVIAGGLWNTLIDPSNVENALLNLAINARDAMNGQGRLTIEAGNAFLDAAYVDAHEDVTAGQYVLLAVTDTGTGMPPDVVDKVFEPFFTTKPEGRGTGLGLSMVYGFVKQSGGHIKIYSEPGHGTTIKLYLPRSTQSEDLIVDVDTGPVTGGTETILVAEDDDAVRDTVVAMLGDLGYRVLKARDAQSAMSIIESGVPIDLLFTDVVMPGPLKSPEVARQARERLPNIAVLFTSGYTENSIVHGGRLDEGVELLSKPYTREMLARRLRQVLANQAQRRVPAHADAKVAPAQTLQPARIIVCEDDWLIRATVVEMLQMKGHDVREAGDALAALALHSQMPADVLITDVSLPGMSGVELARTLRTQHPELVVIFATGHANVAGVEAGARTAVLSKPYGSELLVTTMASLIPGAHTA
ncbi:PAS domain S-box-containing protein [Luteibacter sp. Sphag1AF]|uniref:PAS domain S-box protein n=1 Tax=Luteibacter sp. Sphag1AF TaxID=2587031 RepID=UPI0017A75FCD|nr:PAS domain S-box protein [Luteibacter sp. Sphag1AF]MBB3226532.1 PAS domain S-box-containing protein [Luteibacter sp. Sphag1AF]